MAAHLSNLDQQFAQQEQSAQDTSQEHADQHAAFMRDNFGTSFDVIPNTHEAANAYLQQATNNDPNGAHVPAGVIVGPHAIYVPKQDDNTPNQQLQQIQKIGDALGLPEPDQKTWNSMNPGQQSAAAASAQNFFLGRDPKDGSLHSEKDLPGVIADYQTKLDAYQQRDDADPRVTKVMQSTVDSLSSQLNGYTKNAAAQAWSEG